jgi:hypothetical protein
MVTCTDNNSQQFVNGEWQDAIVCFLTNSGDPTLSVVIPLFCFGAVMISYFIVGKSPVIPAVVSLVLGGVLFAAFPADALTIIGIAVLLVVTVGGLALTWRLGE